MKVRRATSQQNECRAPDCRALVLNWSRGFCPGCQQRLDRVKKQLESSSRDAGGRKSRHAALPTVSTLDPARAASFDAGLSRRAAHGTPLSERDRSIRAVRIIQMKRARQPLSAILNQLCLADKDELDKELTWYQSRQEVASLRKGWGQKRDVSTDKAILAQLRDSNRSRDELALELGLTRAALNSRLSRLRREGHEVPDARRTRGSQVA